MLPGYWALAGRFPPALAALTEGSGIAAEEFATVAARLRAGDDPAAVLDARFVAAFAIAGTPADCAAQIAASAGATELALTFDDPGGMRALAEAVASRRVG
jgi:hypothetical protein